MFHMRLRTSRLTQPEMIASQHYTWLFRIAGPGSGAPRCVSLDSVQPTDQVPGRRSDGGGPGRGVGLVKVQAAHAADTSHRLCSYLNQIVLTGKSHRTADHRVLGSFRNCRPAPLRSRGGRPGMTGGQPTPEQEDDPENFRARSLASYPARDGEEPYHWNQVHADGLRW